MELSPRSGIAAGFPRSAEVATIFGAASLPPLLAFAAPPPQNDAPLPVGRRRRALQRHGDERIEELLQQIDIIITAESFPSQLTGYEGSGTALRAIRDTYQPAMVCMTLGEKGSLALIGDTEIRTPGFSVPVVDTTGSGDVFRGGFIAGWIQGEGISPVADVLRYANAVAALKCRGLGARAAIPSKAEVDSLLRA